jgi:hypothetical protein
MQRTPGFKSRLATGAAALAVLAACPAVAPANATSTTLANRNACVAALRSLGPRQHRYVVALMSLTYTKLAAAFGTQEVHVSTTPIESCKTAE